MKIEKEKKVFEVIFNEKDKEYIFAESFDKAEVIAKSRGKTIISLKELENV